MYVVEEVSLEDVLPLRQEVLRDGAPVESSYFDSDRDDSLFYHFAIKDPDGMGVLAIISFYQNVTADISDLPAGAWRLRGMAVSPDAQGQGMGTILFNQAMNILVDKNIPAVWCNARLRALNFYKRLDFEVRGSVFDIPGIGPHYKMVRFL